MQPAQAAALLGREIDAGFAAAFTDLASSRALVVDRIVARVGALPPTSGDVQGASLDWAMVSWAAEVTLTPATLGAQLGKAGRELSHQSSAASEAAEGIRGRIAELPARRIRGIGPDWAARFGAWGLRTIADLAAEDPSVIVRRAGAHASVALPLLSRARDLTLPWPPVPAAVAGRTITQLAHAAPPPDDLAQHQLRAHCLRVLGALDAAQAARLTL